MTRQPRDPLPPPRPRRPLPVGPTIVPSEPDQPQPVGQADAGDDDTGQADLPPQAADVADDVDAADVADGDGER